MLPSVCTMSTFFLYFLLLPKLSFSVYEESQKQLELHTAIMVNQMALAQHTDLLSKVLNFSQNAEHQQLCCYVEGFGRSVAELSSIKDSLVSFFEKNNKINKQERCPHPYTEVVYECFYAHPKKLTWQQARRVCNGMGGDLAEPDNVYALQAHLAELYGPQGPSYFWVGGSDLKAEGSWTWLSGRPINANDWLFARPDNLAGDEHCLEIVMSDYPNLFNDETCTVLQRFICQYKH